VALFGTDWRDITRYDLVLNVAQLGIKGVAQIIVEAARLERYQPTAASERDFKNLFLAIRVRAVLVTSSKFRDLGVSVRAENGEIHVLGAFARSISEEELVRVIKNIPGVTKVLADCLPADLGEGLPLM
jgi:hypothetical protein